jgi:beta-1,4-mannosyl-glycoprotein beta-1,4-N-acetylglucosaminyltransferase
MKIIDAFSFYNEIEMLSYRLNVLNDQVDYFILSESTHTHAGHPKPLHYKENLNLFERFSHKIIHVVVDDFKYKYPNIDYRFEHQWVNESHQRNCVERGLVNLNLQDEDVIMISDLDEIIDPRTISKVKSGEIEIDINEFEMDMYYYNLNSKIDLKWIDSKILSYKRYRSLGKTFTNIRGHKGAQKIGKGGWHLSYFGDSQFIKNKIQEFGHQELNLEQFTNLEKIEERINNSEDLFNRRNIEINKISINDNDYLPVDFDKHLKNFYTY